VVVVGAVLRNPSPRANSLLTGKITGNLEFFAFLRGAFGQNCAQYQFFTAKFPKHENRELAGDIRVIIFANREILSQDFCHIIPVGRNEKVMG
jgi:hypothetical protein